MSVPVNSFVFCGRLTKSGILKFKTVFFFARDILLFPQEATASNLRLVPGDDDEDMMDIQHWYLFIRCYTEWEGRLLTSFVQKD